MCLYPKIIKNRKYTATKKNGGVVPAIKDKRTAYVPVGCGKCMECKKQKARNWQVRLSEEIRTEKNGKFITLTFSDEEYTKLSKEINGNKGYELDNAIATLATRRFLERWRKKYGKSVRHWLVTELGQNGKEGIHLHGIIWTNELEEISKIWKYGRITIGEKVYNEGKALNNKSTGYVSEKTVNYIIKYVTKTDEKHKEYESKILTSAGIGKNYINRKDSEKNKYKENETQETYTTRKGFKIALPTYYKNAIYTEEEKEKLWIEKLDKKERWVGGERVDISKGEEEYYKLLKYYREKNKRLGYGSDEKNWERKRYETARRKLKQKERYSRESLALPSQMNLEKKFIRSDGHNKKNIQIELGLMEENCIFVMGIDPTNGKIIKM